MAKKRKVPLEAQGHLVAMGMTDVEVFSKIEANENDLRQLLKTQLRFREDAVLDGKRCVASVCPAYEAAQIRGTKRKAEDAEQRAHDLPRTLPHQAHVLLLRAFAERHFDLKDDRTPHKDTIDATIAQLEDNNLVPERLMEVISKDDVQDDNWATAKVQPDGTLKLHKGGRREIAAPSNSEDLRKRMRLLATKWELVRLQCPSKYQVQGVTLGLLDPQVDYLLGDDVLMARVMLPDGKFFFSPAWSTVLEYDYQIRKEACRLVNVKAMPLVKALATAREDEPLKQRHFNGPTSLAAGAAAAQMALSSVAASSTSLPTMPAQIPQPNAEAALKRSQAEVERLRAALQKKKDDVSSGGKAAGKNAGKGAGKVKAKTKAKSAPKSGGKSKHQKIHILSIKAGKCFRHNQNICKVLNCEWPHDCAICGRPDCAAHYHDDA